MELQYEPLTEIKMGLRSFLAQTRVISDLSASFRNLALCIITDEVSAKLTTVGLKPTPVLRFG